MIFLFKFVNLNISLLGSSNCSIHSQSPFTTTVDIPQTKTFQFQSKFFYIMLILNQCLVAKVAETKFTKFNINSIHFNFKTCSMRVAWVTQDPNYSLSPRRHQITKIKLQIHKWRIICIFSRNSIMIQSWPQMKRSPVSGPHSGQSKELPPLCTSGPLTDHCSLLSWPGQAHVTWVFMHPPDLVRVQYALRLMTRRRTHRSDVLCSCRISCGHYLSCYRRSPERIQIISFLCGEWSVTLKYNFKRYETEAGSGEAGAPLAYVLESPMDTNLSLNGSKRVYFMADTGEADLEPLAPGDEVTQPVTGSPTATAVVSSVSQGAPGPANTVTQDTAGTSRNVTEDRYNKSGGESSQEFKCKMEEHSRLLSIARPVRTDGIYNDLIINEPGVHEMLFNARECPRNMAELGHNLMALFSCLHRERGDGTSYATHVPEVCSGCGPALGWALDTKILFDFNIKNNNNIHAPHVGGTRKNDLLLSYFNTCNVTAQGAPPALCRPRPHDTALLPPLPPPTPGLPPPTPGPPPPLLWPSQVLQRAAPGGHGAAPSAAIGPVAWTRGVPSHAGHYTSPVGDHGPGGMEPNSEVFNGGLQQHSLGSLTALQHYHGAKGPRPVMSLDTSYTDTERSPSGLLTAPQGDGHQPCVVPNNMLMPRQSNLLGFIPVPHLKPSSHESSIDFYLAHQCVPEPRPPALSYAWSNDACSPMYVYTGGSKCSGLKQLIVCGNHCTLLQPTEWQKHNYSLIIDYAMYIHRQMSDPSFLSFPPKLRKDLRKAQQSCLDSAVSLLETGSVFKALYSLFKLSHGVPSMSHFLGQGISPLPQWRYVPWPHDTVPVSERAM